MNPPLSHRQNHISLARLHAFRSFMPGRPFYLIPIVVIELPHNYLTPFPLSTPRTGYGLSKTSLAESSDTS